VADGGVPGLAALVDLATAGDLEGAASGFERAWLELHHQADRGEVRELLRLLPDSLLTAGTGLRFAAVDCGLLPAAAAVAAGTASSSGAGADELDVVVDRLVAAERHRQAGEFLRARIELDEVVPVLDRLAHDPGRTSAVVFVRTQLGLAALLSGDLAQADSWLGSALTRASAAARAHVGALLALVQAVSGDGVSADELLARLDADPATGPGASRRAGDPRYLARAVRGLDRGELAAVDRMVRARTPGSFGPLWPVALWVHTQYLLLTGRHPQGLRLVEQAEAGQPPGATGDGIGRDVLDAARAELDAATGRLDRAWQVVGHARAPGHWTAVAEVVVLYASGEFDAVRYAVHRTQASHHLPRRERVRLRGLEAAAGLAQGRARLATEELRALLADAADHGWTAVAPHLPAPLVELGTRSGLLEDGGAAAARPWIPAPAVRSPLSPREREVFHLVLAGDSREQMATELGVTVNTVKTQVRHIYAKLGVTGRGELLHKVSRMPPWWSSQ
jgi:LuxR family transcriptional regulator, maltose regulon positive regulatory protein